MKKNLLSLVLTASLICGMMPVEELGQMASAADSSASGGIEATSDTADASNAAKEGEETVVSGTFGGTKDSTGAVLTPDTHQWSLAKESGVLTISGEGDMPDYTTSTTQETPWYTYKDDIKKIVFTGDVTTVGVYAFYSYTKVEEVDFSAAEDLTAIHASAFQSTSALKALTGTENIETLEASCFRSSALKSVSMPNVESVPQNAFRTCDLTSIAFENATIFSSESFYYNEELKEVHAPSVETLDGKVFGSCAFESISLPNLVSITGGYTFNNCTNLKKMSFPRLSSIAGASIFEGCTSLETIDLPGVTSTSNISGFATGCTNLLWASLPNASIDSAIGFQQCYSLVYVDISGMTELDWNRYFTDCYSLKRLYIKGNQLTANVDTDFYTGLSNLNLPNKPEIYIMSANKTKFTKPSNNTVAVIRAMDDDAAFAAAKAKETDVRITQEDYNIESPALPKVTGTVTGAEVTYNYYTDSKCRVPVNDSNPSQKPTVPGPYYMRATAGAVDGVAFETLSNIVPFKVFGEIKEDGWSFMYGQGTLTITDAKVMDTEYASASQTPWYAWQNDILEIDIMEGVTLTKIAPYAFSGLSKFTYFDLPDTVTSIGARAFYGCTAWGSDSDKPVKDVLTDQVTSIGEYAFYNCSAITGTMAFSNSITEIPAYVLYGCKGVTRITYSDNVTSFGASCFNGTGITDISFPAGITEYPDVFFENCTNLTSATLPQEVTSLPSRFFHGCKGLTDFTLPQGIAELPDQLFLTCSSLTQITVPDTVKSIGNLCFQQSGLTSITLPEGVESIGTQAFYSCSALESIEFPTTLTTLSESAFADTGLKKMIVPSTVTNIGKGVFRECGSLTYLEFLNDNYTADTFALCPSGGGSLLTDATFSGLPADTMIVCDGSTYEFLSTVEVNENNKVWDPKAIIYKRSALLEDLQTDYAAVKAEAAKLSQADYDATLWSDFQAALQAADELFALGGDDTYEKVQNMMAAKKAIPTAAKIFLRDTWSKANVAIGTAGDYDTEGDGADAWYAFMDAADAAMTVLQKEDAAFSDIIDCDKKLKQASGQIVLLPTTSAKADYDKTVEEARALSESDYTPESWAALQAALSEAEELMKTADRISLVNAAQKKVSDAVSALVEADKGEPSANPSANPSAKPSTNPSSNPSANPSTNPSTNPSAKPSTNPSAKPSTNPSAKPSTNPSTTPSVKPSVAPTKRPETKVNVKKATIKKVKSAKKKTMLVQWKKLAGVTGYQVQIALKKNFKKGKKTYTVKKAKTVKKTIKKLKRKKKNFVRVRAYKAVKGKKYYGKWSKVKTVKVK